MSQGRGRDAAGLEKPGLFGSQEQVQLESDEERMALMKRPVLPHAVLGTVCNNKFNAGHMGFRFELNKAQTIFHFRATGAPQEKRSHSP